MRAYEDRERESQLEQFIVALVEVGALPREFPLHYRFVNSRAEYEKQNEAHWKWLRNWPRENNLYIWGPTGTGKTHACCCAMLDYAARGKSIGMTSGYDLAETGMAARFNERARNAMREWCNVDILLVDDVDKARWDERTLPVLQHVMDKRSLFKAPRRVTIFTSNASPVAFKRLLVSAAPQENLSYVEAILSRLNPCDKLEFVGESLREKATQP